MKNSQKGFSLLEMVASIFVLGVVAVSVAPNLGTASTKVSIDSAAKSVEADLRYAQSMASTTGETYGFEAITSTTYRIYKIATGAGKTTVKSPVDHQNMSVDFASEYSDVQFGAGSYPAYTIEFGSDGRPITGGGTNIILSNADATSTKQVSVVNSTGNISML